MHNSPNKTYSDINYTSNAKSIKDPLRDSGSKTKPILLTREFKSNNIAIGSIQSILKKPNSYIVNILNKV